MRLKMIGHELTFFFIGNNAIHWKKTLCVHKECTQESWCYNGDEIDVKCKDPKKEMTDLELKNPQTVAQSYRVLENNS